MSRVIPQIEAQKALISKIFISDQTYHQTGSCYNCKQGHLTHHLEAFTMLISMSTFLSQKTTQKRKNREINNSLNFFEMTS